VIPGKNWFLDTSLRKIGNGHSTSFWNVKWIGDGPLADVFPRLFLLSNHKENNVRDFFENGEWSFMWRRNLFRWEEDLVSFEAPLRAGVFYYGGG
jgi:hypothetical protein